MEQSQIPTGQSPYLYHTYHDSKNEFHQPKKLTMLTMLRYKHQVPHFVLFLGQKN